MIYTELVISWAQHWLLIVTNMPTYLVMTFLGFMNWVNSVQSGGYVV